jgi:sugar/nucleoside kinase (ribokinase family)
MLDLYGLGNAIVDTDVQIDDDFLSDEGLAKGQMTLVDSSRMANLVSKLESRPMRKCSGGSAANTVFAAQAFGLSTRYTCRLADDENGRHFSNEMQNAGVATSSISETASENRRSGQCLVMISPDAQRTMCTDLGVSSELGREIVDVDALRSARSLYIEGYLSAGEQSIQTAAYCQQIAKDAGTLVALTLSDVSMITFCKDGLKTMLGDGVHTLFCNAQEALAWSKTDRLDVAIAELSDIAQELYVTLGASGAQAVTQAGSWRASGEVVTPLDTNGAGDIFAGACLAARLQGASPRDAATFANRAAAKIITQFGARLPSVDDYKRLMT